MQSPLKNTTMHTSLSHTSPIRRTDIRYTINTRKKHTNKSTKMIMTNGQSCRRTIHTVQIHTVQIHIFSLNTMISRIATMDHRQE